MQHDDNTLERLQRRFIIATAAVAPFAPLLYLQGQITRWRVGVLPDAAGPFEGKVGNGDSIERLFVIGESTVAGLGARDHERALTGQFAACLSERLEKAIEWRVVGRNGVTARRTIDELLPQMPAIEFDHILVGLGGNDVMKLSSPRKWRRDMTELLTHLRERSPRAKIYITNCPMIKYSPALPTPIRQILWELSKMHDANIREFTAGLDRVYYYPQPAEVRLEGFFADGLHPSEQGYADWARAMADHFAAAGAFRS